MKIVALSDIHSDIESVRKISRHLSMVDVVLLVGDLTLFGRERDAARVMDAVREHNPKVLAVAGNCDYPDVETYLAKEGISLHRKHRVVDNVAFAGVGGALPFRTLNEFSEEEFQRFLSEACVGLPAGMPVLLVSHQPPFQTVADRASSGVHVGSHAIRVFIEEVKPLICFTGHIHEGKGIDAIGQTMVINPAPLIRGGYAYAEVSDHVDVLDIISFK